MYVTAGERVEPCPWPAAVNVRSVDCFLGIGVTEEAAARVDTRERAAAQLGR